jgi:hypothetical protein
LATANGNLLTVSYEGKWPSGKLKYPRFNKLIEHVSWEEVQKKHRTQENIHALET